MKLKIDTLYSQRDNRWINIFLGFNTVSPYTIGNYGCLITCYAMYLTAIGKTETPTTVNDALKANNGFVSGGLLVWTVPPKVWNIEEVYVSPKYDGPVSNYGIQKMKALLDEGRPLICEVDFNPATEGEEMHFILVSGYQDDKFFMCDPWTGELLSLDVYGGAVRAVIQFRAFNITVPKYETPPTSCEVELQKCKEQVDLEVKNKNETWNELQDLKKERDGLKAEIDSLRNFINSYAVKLNCADDPATIMGKIGELINLEDSLNKTIRERDDAVVEKNRIAIELQVIQSENTKFKEETGILNDKLNSYIAEIAKLKSQTVSQDYKISLHLPFGLLLIRKK